MEELSRTLEKTDLAVRSLRIIARRVITVIDELDAKATTADDVDKLADWFSEVADAVAVLGRSASEPAAPGRHRSLSIARDALGAVTTKLTPTNLGANTLHGEALVMMCSSNDGRFLGSYRLGPSRSQQLPAPPVIFIVSPGAARLNPWPKRRPARSLPINAPNAVG